MPWVVHLEVLPIDLKEGLNIRVRGMLKVDHKWASSLNQLGGLTWHYLFES
jgi:hypothetical protein